MLDRFPLTQDDFRLNFGVRAIPPHEPLIVATDEYTAEIQLKQHLLRDQLDKCWAATPASAPAQAEAVDLLRSRCDERHPLLSSRDHGSNGDSEPALLAIGRLIQEDLILLSDDAPQGFPIIAGSVCFPSGWALSDKLGQLQSCVHAAVPNFKQQLLSPSLKLLARLKAGRSVSRSNWSVRALGRLNQFPCDAAEIRTASEAVTPQTAAECMFRVEFQTLSRLAETRAILFTIHTFQRPLKTLLPPERTRLARVIETCPEPTLRYKGIWPMRASVIAWLTAENA